MARASWSVLKWPERRGTMACAYVAPTSGTCCASEVLLLLSCSIAQWGGCQSCVGRLRAHLLAYVACCETSGDIQVLLPCSIAHFGVAASAFSDFGPYVDNLRALPAEAALVDYVRACCARSLLKDDRRYTRYPSSARGAYGLSPPRHFRACRLARSTPDTQAPNYTDVDG